MRIAAGGSLAGWALALVARWSAPRGLAGVSILVAAQFSILLALHLVAWLVRAVFEPSGPGRTEVVGQERPPTAARTG